MNRRTLTSALAAGLFALLAGCAAVPGNSAPTPGALDAVVIADVKLVAQAVRPLSAVLAATPGIKPEAAIAVAAYVIRIEAAADTIVPGVTAAAARPSVETISTAVNGIVEALSGLPLPESVIKVVNSAQAVLPLVELAVGIACEVGGNPDAPPVATARMTLQAGLR